MKTVEQLSIEDLNDIAGEKPVSIICGDYFSDHVICCYLEKDNDKIKYSFSLEG